MCNACVLCNTNTRLTLLIRANNKHSKKVHDSTISHLGSVREWNATYGETGIFPTSKSCAPFARGDYSPMMKSCSPVFAVITGALERSI